MEHTHDRRVSGVRRVSVERLVDICDKSLTQSAFQARSIDVSGRGMQVRTRFLPELEAPLVLRFQEQDAEIIVEGEVAWRTETPDGGDFGVRFTALDSQSVLRLKSLCSEAEPAEPALGAGVADASGAEEAPEQTDHDLPPVVSSSVKLHVAGLSAPMRAEVKEQGHRRLDVGSNLEFLRVGRELTVEEVELGRRRQAEIESVHIAIDPRTQIPQLILSLRYPEPAPSEGPRPSEPMPKVAYAKSLSDSPDASRGADDDETREPLSEPGVLQPLTAALERASALAEQTGAQCLRLGTTVGRAGRWLVASSGRLLTRQAAKPRRGDGLRRTAAPVLRAPRVVQLRPQHSASSAPRSQPAPASAAQVSVAEARPGVRPALQRSLVLAGLCLSSVALGFWWNSGSTRQPVPSLSKARPAARAESNPASAPVLPLPLPATAPQPPAAERPESGLPAATPALSAGDSASRPSATDAALSRPAERAAPGASSSAPRARVTVPAVTDNAATARRDSGSRRAGNIEFSRGKLHLPIVYRLRLDDAGDRLSGEPTPTGFSVLVAGRKLMETGADIARRDSRIGKVATKNGSDGAKISFSFHGAIPAYKVRLRRDVVEIFVGSD